MTEREYSTDSEKNVLGILLVNGKLIWDVREVLRGSQDFSRSSYRMIYDAMLTLAASGTGIDTVTVHEQLRRDGMLSKMEGGSALLVNLSQTAYHTAEMVMKSAMLVKDQSVRRQLAAYGKGVAARCESSDADAYEELERADQEFQQLHTEMVRPKSPSVAMLSGVVLEELQGRYARYQQMLASGRTEMESTIIGVPTGLDRLDKLMGGLQKGDLILYAGATSMGKSALAMTTTHHVARAGGRVLYISLEMSAESLLLRLAAMYSGIPLHDLRFGRLEPQAWKAAREAIEEIKTLPLAIEDASMMTMLDIRSRARAEQRRHGLALVVVDYLQFVTGPKSERKDLEIGAISRGLKAMAKELDVPVVALSQLSRISGRHDKRPLLTDLRESGSLEQDSDAVVMVYRPEYYHETTHEINGTVYGTDGLAEIILAKHRQGETGSFPATFLKERTMFANHIIRDTELPAIIERPF